MNLNRLSYFAAVVDNGSFTRAAERLGITKAVVSQQVARLERDFRATLRNVRLLRPLCRLGKIAAVLIPC